MYSIFVHKKYRITIIAIPKLLATAMPKTSKMHTFINNVIFPVDAKSLAFQTWTLSVHAQLLIFYICLHCLNVLKL